MSDDETIDEFSDSEITAMRYAYRQLLADHPEPYPDTHAKEQLAKSVVECLQLIRSSPAKTNFDVVKLIMAEDE